MTIRSISLAMILAMLAGAQAQAQAPAVQAVPRAGVAFSHAVTMRAKIESVDAATRTVAFTTGDGRLINLAVADSVRNLDAIGDNATVDISFNEVVTILNLRQKGPGSREARREGAKPDAADLEAGRFTLTVVAVDLPGNKVSVIDGRGGAVRTLAATSVAQKDAIQKIKAGDVIIGMTTPLLVTAITPAR